MYLARRREHLTQLTGGSAVSKQEQCSRWFTTDSAKSIPCEAFYDTLSSKL